VASAEFVVVREDRGGTRKHPEGRYLARIVGFGPPEVGPFGYWFRVTYETAVGIVAGTLSPDFGPETDLGLLYLAAISEWLPDEANVALLVGRSVMIDVVWQREHGALCAVACPAKTGKEQER
jgi:hypothetical protein